MSFYGYDVANIFYYYFIVSCSSYILYDLAKSMQRFAILIGLLHLLMYWFNFNMERIVLIEIKTMFVVYFLIELLVDKKRVHIDKKENSESIIIVALVTLFFGCGIIMMKFVPYILANVLSYLALNKFIISVGRLIGDIVVAIHKFFSQTGIFRVISNIIMFICGYVMNVFWSIGIYVERIMNSLKF